jgi:hypothetical protein
MNLKYSFAAILLFGSTAAHAAITNCSQPCVTTQTTWSASQTAGLSEGPAENTDSGTGGNLPYKKRLEAPTDEDQTYTGSAYSFIAGANQLISLQATGIENTYSVSTGYASASASLIYGFTIEGAPNPFGVAVTFKGYGATESRGDAADNSVDLSIVVTEVDGDMPPVTLLSQDSIGTTPYVYTLFLYPGIQYQVDMEASVYTNGLNGIIGATLDPNITSDKAGYTVLFGDGIGNGAGVPTAPELSTWAMLLAGFAGLGLAGYRRPRAA